MAEEVKLEDDELDALMAELAEQSKSMVSGVPIKEPAFEVPVVGESAPGHVVEVTNTEMELLELEQAADLAAAPEPVPEPSPSQELEKKTADMKVRLQAALGSKQESIAVDVEGEQVTAPEHGPLRYRKDHSEFDRETRINTVDLTSSFTDQSSLLSYYYSQSAAAAVQHNYQKSLFDILEGKLYTEHKAKATASGDKTTDKAIDVMVKQDPRWLRGKSIVLDAEGIAETLKGYCRALENRRDMLNQMGNDARNDQKGAMRQYEEQQRLSAMRERAISAVKGVVSQH